MADYAYVLERGDLDGGPAQQLADDPRDRNLPRRQAPRTCCPPDHLTTAGSPATPRGRSPWKPQHHSGRASVAGRDSSRVAFQRKSRPASWSRISGCSRPWSIIWMPIREKRHHPKEDDSLFARLKRRTSEGADGARLEHDHQGRRGPHQDAGGGRCCATRRARRRRPEGHPRAFDDLPISIATMIPRSARSCRWRASTSPQPTGPRSTRPFVAEQDPMQGAAGEDFRAIFSRLVAAAPPLDRARRRAPIKGMNQSLLHHFLTPAAHPR